GEKVGLRANWTEEDSPEIADLVKAAENATSVDEREEIMIDFATAMQESGPFVPIIVVGANLASDESIDNVQYNSNWTLDIPLITPAGYRRFGVAETKPGASLRRPLQRWPLAAYIVRRLLTSILLMIGVTIVTFALTTLVPGDPITAALGEGAASNQATVDAYVERHGLDKPVPQRYLIYM